MMSKVVSLSRVSIGRGIACRSISLSAVSPVKKITETTTGSTTIVEATDVPLSSAPKAEVADKPHSCALCRYPVKIKYTDVLILEQLMREDGTVLPKQLTGLCTRQQLRLERCVMQAHWSGLFPDRTIPDFDRSGYKRFNRYWDNDIDMYRTQLKEKPGIWFYVNQYNPRGSLFKPAKKAESAKSD
uniref:28S ribosomal protein S18a, mitochondrial n=1 Tax=Panagrellus redivivus TaxID=6233 RepID=A0A7E4UNK6_PANRE